MENVELKQVASNISKRIELLAELSSIDLKNEMSSLKKALLENPAACALLLPEDTGLLVTALRKITGVALVEANKPKERKTATKSKKLSAQELAEALDSDEF